MLEDGIYESRAALARAEGVSRAAVTHCPSPLRRSFFLSTIVVVVSHNAPEQNRTAVSTGTVWLSSEASVASPQWLFAMGGRMRKFVSLTALSVVPLAGCATPLKIARQAEKNLLSAEPVSALSR
jgi:hypothetical protein